MTTAVPRSPVLLSILTACLTIGLKLTGYHLTGSVGLLSDAAESVVNLFAALTAFLSLWYAAQPVDRTHTYGHDKIEFFSSGIEGLLIFVAALGIGYYAVCRLLAPEPLQAVGAGVLIAGLAIPMNFFVARTLLRAGRRHGSIVLEADGRHLMADVWTSLVVILGIGLVQLTHFERLDPLLALFVAVNLVRTAYDLLRRSFDGLMDHSLPPAEQAAVRSAIESQLTPEMHYHALRTRQAGTHRFADFHLLVPGTLTVAEAHAVSERIEQAVQIAFPSIEVAVHIEPIEEQSAWEDSALLPLEKADRQQQR